MKNTTTVSKLAALITLVIVFSVTTKAGDFDDNSNFKELVALGEKLDTEDFQMPNPNEVRTKSNPKLRPVEVVQQNEMVEFEAAGLITSPYTKNAVTQGWLVNSCIVVAPRHAIIGQGNVGKDLTNMQVDFKVGYQGKNSFKQQVKITPISCGHSNIGDSPSLNDGDVSTAAGEDFCIYKTNRSLKGLVKPIKIGAIDFQRYDVVPTTSVGFFPQASGQLDVLAKDVNAKIVDGDSTYLESRAAVISGAGLIKPDDKTKENYLIGMQVGYFKAVNSNRVLEEIESIRAKNANAFKCN